MLGEKFHKHINSLLLFSAWLLSITLFFLLMHLADFRDGIRTHFIFVAFLFLVVGVGIVAFIAWTYFFVIGVSLRVLKWYKNYRFAIEDVLLLIIISIFAILGYLFGRSEILDQYKIQGDRLRVAQDRIHQLEKKLYQYSLSPSPTVPSPIPTKKLSQSEVSNIAAVQTDTTPWGVSRQLDEHTWTMKVAMDSQMATPQEIFTALNEYRHKHARESLGWSDNLAVYAQSRADYFAKIRTTDGHKGFIEYVDNMENRKKLGFWNLGENSSYGYTLMGVHLIEWIFAGDKPHDDNQLDQHWSKVGIGVSGSGVDIIFADQQM